MKKIGSFREAGKLLAARVGSTGETIYNNGKNEFFMHSRRRSAEGVHVSFFARVPGHRSQCAHGRVGLAAT